MRPGHPRQNALCATLWIRLWIRGAYPCIATGKEKAAQERLAKAQEQAARLEGVSIQVTQKAGVDGRLFGSVTNVDVVEALKAQSVEIEKSMIRMPTGPLKQVGEFPLTVVLHTDVTAHISVSVRADATAH